MKKVINAVNQTVMFTFEGGLEPVSLGMWEVSPANATYAMLHGFAARIGDNAAIAKSAENGFRVTEAMRRDAVLELVDHYRSGSVDWSPKAKPRGPSYNPHIQAIAEKKGCSYDEAAAWFQAKLMAELGAE